MPGRIVDPHDHVRITLRALVRLTMSTFRMSLGSMNGPFLVYLDMGYAFLRRTMNLSDGRLPRVRLPSVGLPQGDFGLGMPTGALPSPPPCGWSLGFIAEPRTCGRRRR